MLLDFVVVSKNSVMDIGERVACGPFAEHSRDRSIGFNVLGIPPETNECLASNLHQDCDVHP